MAHFEFDVDKVREESRIVSYDPIPPDAYYATISHADLIPSKNGKGRYINVRFDITGPKYAGRVVYRRFVVEHIASYVAIRGREQFKRMLEAIGYHRINNTDQIIGAHLAIWVDIVPAQGSYPANNEVRDFAPPHQFELLASRWRSRLQSKSFQSHSRHGHDLTLSQPAFMPQAQQFGQQPKPGQQQQSESLQSSQIKQLIQDSVTAAAQSLMQQQQSQMTSFMQQLVQSIQQSLQPSQHQQFLSPAQMPATTTMPQPRIQDPAFPQRWDPEKKAFVYVHEHQQPHQENQENSAQDGEYRPDWAK